MAKGEHKCSPFWIIIVGATLAVAQISSFTYNPARLFAHELLHVVRT